MIPPAVRFARAQNRIIEEMGGICPENDRHSLAVLLVVAGRHLAPPEAGDPWLDRARIVYAEELAQGEPQ